MIDFLIQKFRQYVKDEAFIFADKPYPYEWLVERISYWEENLIARQIKPGAVIILETDISPDAVALFLALVNQRCIVVPITSALHAKKEEFSEIAQGETDFRITADGKVCVSETGRAADHEWYRLLRAENHPGLVLFSSGR